MKSVNINSEVGRLRQVIVHQPGPEVEKMTPENAEKALYSDILNGKVALNEYQQFKGVLDRYCTTYEVKDLLTEILGDKKVKKELITTICQNENVSELIKELIELDDQETSRQLIEGVEIKRDNLTKYLSDERYSLLPLHNFFFTRDSSMTLYNKVLIGKMASNVRMRESLIMNAIFKNSEHFKAKTINPNVISNSKKITIEGGDVLVAREDVLLIGTGMRTSTAGIDFIIEAVKEMKKERQVIIAQELPSSPESFIHLDMVFTLLDKDTCMVYEPLILQTNKYRTIKIIIENGEVQSIDTEINLVEALKSVGMPLNVVKCGDHDLWNQEREQWHSGANFLAVAPGVVIGYERNVHTIDALAKNGYQVIKASDVIKLVESELPMSKTVITIEGSELARGGGGARCMSMPVTRDKIEF